MPATILIADDDADLLHLTALVLQAAGHSVLRASDGAAALAIARDRRPDLIVSDVMMPGLSGVELAVRLRAGADDGPPILLMSGAVESPAPLSRCTFLAKPFDIAAMLRAVAALLPA